MSKRSELINHDSLEGIHLHHPYLKLLQKDDWREYLCLIAEIYDLLEEDNAALPYDVLRSFLVQFYADKRDQGIDGKVNQFIHMCIVELDAFRDRHDSMGNRYIETTRAGKDLLKLFEELLSKKTRFTGLSADTMLAALNGLLLSQKSITVEQALLHHREKIKAYQADIKLIESQGVSKSELLPGDFSKEELLQQAEAAALHILTAVEDVKISVEGVRKKLAQAYLKMDGSAGRSINVIADFYAELQKSPEFRSYSQAYDLLSHLDGIGGRFKFRDVDTLMSFLLKNGSIDYDEYKKNHLASFKQRFYRSHSIIEDKKRAQLRLLQQQVLYAISRDSRKIEANLRELQSLLYSDREKSLQFFDEVDFPIMIPNQFDWGALALNEFETPISIPSEKISLNEMTQDESRILAKALLEAEEATIKKILSGLREVLKEKKVLRLSEHSIEKGVVEYYVLLEADTLDYGINKIEKGTADIFIATRWGEYVVWRSQDYEYTLRSENE